MIGWHILSMFSGKIALTKSQRDLRRKLLIMGSRVRVPPRSPSKIRHFWHFQGFSEKPCVCTVSTNQLPGRPLARGASPYAVTGPVSGRDDDGRGLDGDHLRADVACPRGCSLDDDANARALGRAEPAVLPCDVGDLLEHLDGADLGHVVLADVGDGVEAV